MLLIGSPKCRIFNQLQTLSGWDHKKQAQYAEAVEHVRFVISLYKIQLEAGRLFLHEHPAGATSWSLREVEKMAGEEGVNVVVGDQCMFGLKAKSGQGWGLAKKPTRFMTD